MANYKPRLSQTDLARAEALEVFREAGVGILPGEGEEEARERNAVSLYHAEQWLQSAGGTVEWPYDPESSHEYGEDCFGCVVTVEGEQSSLWGLLEADVMSDFGRCVVAELARELRQRLES